MRCAQLPQKRIISFIFIKMDIYELTAAINIRSLHFMMIIITVTLTVAAIQWQRKHSLRWTFDASHITISIALFGFYMHGIECSFPLEGRITFCWHIFSCLLLHCFLDNISCKNFRRCKIRSLYQSFNIKYRTFDVCFLKNMIKFNMILRTSILLPLWFSLLNTRTGSDWTLKKSYEYFYKYKETTDYSRRWHTHKNMSQYHIDSCSCSCSCSKCSAWNPEWNLCIKLLTWNDYIPNCFSFVSL